MLMCSFSLIASTSKKVINIFLVGPGLVGEELLNQINAKFHSDMPTEIRVLGIANSRSMYFQSTGIDLNDWKSTLNESRTSMSIEAFIHQMVFLKAPKSVFVDCTSSQLVADSYQKILQSDISIVTPNKKANSGLFSDYCALMNLLQNNHLKFLYDTNVGAGLPFLKTIKSIKQSADTVVEIEAILSGTLSYLFNTFDGSVPFSEVLREAQEQGYTEPDPRDDLNGLDMARKFLILAREAGQNLEMSDIIIDSFIPENCLTASTVEEFYQKLKDSDEKFSLLVENARRNEEVLRFTGKFENGQVKLSLKAVNKNHPFYNLSGTDNIGSIKTLIYSNNPIVIKGPGAGARVTAANVLANIVEAGSPLFYPR